MRFFNYTVMQLAWLMKNLCRTFFQFEQLQSCVKNKRIKKRTTKKPVKHIREVLWICTRAYIDTYTRLLCRASPFTHGYTCTCTRAHARARAFPSLLPFLPFLFAFSIFSLLSSPLSFLFHFLICPFLFPSPSLISSPTSFADPRACVRIRTCVCMPARVCMCVLTPAWADESVWMVRRCACGSACFSLCACVRS